MRFAEGQEMLAAQGIFLHDPISLPHDDPILSDSIFLQDLAGNSFNAQTCLWAAMILLTVLAKLDLMHSPGDV